MARNLTLRQQRDESIRRRYREIKRKNPKWSWVALIAEVSQEYFLTPSTIGRIINEGDDQVPCANTIIRHVELATA